MQNTLCKIFGYQWAWQHTKPPTKWIPNFLKTFRQKKNYKGCLRRVTSKRVSEKKCEKSCIKPQKGVYLHKIKPQKGV